MAAAGKKWLVGGGIVVIVSATAFLTARSSVPDYPFIRRLGGVEDYARERDEAQRGHHSRVFRFAINYLKVHKAMAPELLADGWSDVGDEHFKRGQETATILLWGYPDESASGTCVVIFDTNSKAAWLRDNLVGFRKRHLGW